MSDDKFSHLDEHGQAHMVDVGSKEITRRRALASGCIQMSESTMSAIQSDEVPKGSVLTVARIAGIQAAKECSRLIPLCHSLPLDQVQIDFEFSSSTQLSVRATAIISARTGVEMEALTAVSVSLLTIYDMCKALDKGMQIQNIQLEEKEGGRSGHWKRSQ